MELNRKNIALLQQIKRLVKKEQGHVLHYDSPTLQSDLKTLVKSGVSADLLRLIENFLLTSDDSAMPAQSKSSKRVYRGCEVLADDSRRVHENASRIYRGHLVSS